MRKSWIFGGALLVLAACGGKRTEAEHQLLQWATALNHHLATDIAGGNEYPHELAEIDDMLRIGLSFDDPWGNPVYYRRINDGKYDLVSIGADGELGSDDDVIVSNGLLYKPEKIYGQRPAAKGLRPQSPSGALDDEG